MIHVTSDKREDQTGVVIFDDHAVIDVQSESGIGGIAAERQSATWPDEIRIRLHTRGLERLEIGYGNKIITTGVSSNSGAGPGAVLYVIDVDGETEETADPPPDTIPDIQIVSESAEPSIPLEDGYFAILMPPDFFTGDYDSFTVQWIDFYR